MADFYLIRDTKIGKYFDGRFFRFTCETPGESLARFASEKNATDEIRKFRSRGHNVDDLIIVPATVLPLPSIKPKLSEQRPGFVIRVTHRDGVTFWKGNKKIPKVDYGALFHGPQAPHTASVFTSRTEADAVLAKFQAELPALIKFYKEQHREDVRRHKDGYYGSPQRGRAPGDAYTPLLESVKLDVVLVG